LSASFQHDPNSGLNWLFLNRRRFCSGTDHFMDVYATATSGVPGASQFRPMEKPMLLSTWRRFIEWTVSPSRNMARRLRSSRLLCEALECRCQPSVFAFHTGLPDGRIGTVTEPANAHNSNVEFESADDFVLPSATRIDNASFTGLLTGGATAADVSDIVVEIYRVFPNDSDLTRTPNVPTRMNSPSDVAFDSRDSAARELAFRAVVLDSSFDVQNSVSSADKISVNSGGNGALSGEEVRFDVKLIVPFDLPADHYFFVPQVGLADVAPAGAHFLWLSTARIVVPQAPNKPPRPPDLQSWMRDDPPLAPDWLRVGTDIIGGTTFNASFDLHGIVQASGATAVPEAATNLFSSMRASDNSDAVHAKNEEASLATEAPTAMPGLPSSANAQKVPLNSGPALHHFQKTVRTPSFEDGTDGLSAI
jgi:hypothetical protein